MSDENKTGPDQPIHTNHINTSARFSGGSNLGGIYWMPPEVGIESAIQSAPKQVVVYFDRETTVRFEWAPEKQGEILSAFGIKTDTSNERDPVTAPSSMARRYIEKAKPFPWRGILKALAALGAGMILGALSGCTNCPKLAAPSQAIATDLPLYMDLVAPVSTLTPSQVQKVEALGKKLKENAAKLAEAANE